MGPRIMIDATLRAACLRTADKSATTWKRESCLQFAATP